MAHSALKSLPDEVLTKIDLALVKGKPTQLLAQALHKEGYLKDISEASLSRALRKYRLSEIDEKAEARQVSIRTNPNPAQQKRILDKANDYDVVANWLKLIKRQEARVDKWLASGAGNLPSTAILSDIKALGELYQKFNTACMDRGLLPRAATNVNLRAEMIVVDATNVQTVIQALNRFMENEGVGLPNTKYQREDVENAQVALVVQEMRRIAEMPDDEFETELNAGSLPEIEGEVVEIVHDDLNERAVRVD